MVVTLTGFMGVGKSTIADMLSRILLCAHIDLDTFVENKENKTIPEIFAEMGEKYFRVKESEALTEILLGKNDSLLILSLGGGALISETNRELVRKHSTCIYLSADFNTLSKRLVKGKRGRPFLSDLSCTEEEERIRQLFKIREDGYLQTAAHIVNTDEKSIRQIVDEIIKLL
jgi:shikimate kinase